MRRDLLSALIAPLTAPITETPPAIRFTYTPETFGLLVAEVVKEYTMAQRQAFLAGFLGAMREEAINEDS